MSDYKVYTTHNNDPATLRGHDTSEAALAFLKAKGLVTDEEVKQGFITEDSHPDIEIYRGVPTDHWFEKNWIGGRYFTVGDYGGGGAVGAANLRYLEEECIHWEDYHRTCGGHSSEWAWLRPNEKGQELLAQLEDYPCLDDELVGVIELEWEKRDFEDWTKDELLRHTSEFDELILKHAGTMDRVFDEAYYQAKISTGIEYESEYNGGCIDTEGLRESFLSHCRTELAKWEHLRKLYKEPEADGAA